MSVSYTDSVLIYFYENLATQAFKKVKHGYQGKNGVFSYYSKRI